jgi:hypothetical protein
MATVSDTRRIETGKVSNRRALRFGSIDELLADVDRLAAAERAGKLRRLGNWTLGQALGHLAGWMEYAYTPAPMKPPFFIRWILRMRKKKYLYGSMRPGVWIPRVEGGTLNTAPMGLEEGLMRYRAIADRLKKDAPTVESQAFGPLTHEEAIALNLRHAELHLSFFVPE